MKQRTTPSTETSKLPFFYKPQPGADPYDDSLLDDLARARTRRGKGYVPRTRHLRSDGEALYTNRLFLESSPYLLQHAHNPVNWYPWGNEAFETAKHLKRPVFLSVGYATCHWCHVMEEESFEDEEIAKFLNAHFICIKVDREERPDIDAVYMATVQALTGQGGWPMSVWLNPDRTPFYGGTYFPARDGDRGAPMGFLTLLKKLQESFHYPDGRAENAGRQITDAIRRLMASAPGNRLPEPNVLETAAHWYRTRYDAKFGGLRGAPKFPSGLPIRFLLREHRRTGDFRLLEMAEHSLDQMARGGIYDQVGGGFHRYATDEGWRVPHFEKMLYDNALLATAYTEAWQASGKEDFRRIAEDILTYVGREMTAPGGAFYAATDADSRNPDGRLEEGWFFTWTPEELEQVLGKDRAAILTSYYGMGKSPDFEGRWILHRPRPAADVAAAEHLTEETLLKIVEDARNDLYAERGRRPAPLRDEKILASWNGLMISALARTGLAFGQPAYTKQAAAAARFLLEHLHPGNRLFRGFQEGKPRHTACLEDYAFLIAALLDLYEVTFDINWLKHAFQLDDELQARYEDPDHGGFFTTPTDHEALIAREKPWQDGAVPSGNAVCALNLLRLAALTTDDAYRVRAEKLLLCFADHLAAHPTALSEMLLAVDFYLDAPLEIVLVVPDDATDGGRPFLDVLRRRFLPNRVLAGGAASAIDDLAAALPLVRGKALLQGRAAAYVCEQGACGLPLDDPQNFALRLQGQKTTGGRADQ